MTGLRIVSWNCAMALHRKAAALLALRPDVAIVSECSQVAELGDGELVWVAWTGTWDPKGLAVYARPDLEATLDGSFDPALRWFRPFRVGGDLPMSILAAWAMHDPHPDEPPPKLPTLRALDAYDAFLRSWDSLVIGDLNNHDRWDTGLSFALATSQCNGGLRDEVFQNRPGRRVFARPKANVRSRRPLARLFAAQVRPW